MSKNNREAINAAETLGARALRGLARITGGMMLVTVKGRTSEALSYFDAPAPELSLADKLDRLDAIADQEMVAAKMSHIEIHKTEAR